MPARKYRRDTSEVSCCLKYAIFGFNVFFWWLGLGVMAVGFWAWKEKDTFSNFPRLTNVALDPAFIFILVGTIATVIGFTGCVGALRENTCLLATYSFILTSLLLLEMTLGVLSFIFKDWIKAQATGGFQAFIIHYRDDPDQQNLIDWIQEDWLQCCGIEGPKDWDKNNYFNCSSSEIGSSEACGVPFSCCKRETNTMNGITKNKQCGYNVRKPGNNRDLEIHERGCIQAAEDWMDRNLLVISTSIVATAFTQILGICFAQNLRADIFAQKAKWH